MSKINRKNLVNRHNIVITQPDNRVPLTVGNGKFGFTADVTGLQTFDAYLGKGNPIKSRGSAFNKCPILLVDISKIKAGFITHMHSDHITSLTCFAKLYAKFTNFLYNSASVEVYMPDGIEAFLAWLDAINLEMSDRMILTELKEGVFYSTAKLKVKAVRTEHLGKDKPSYAFVFEADGKKVLFTGDLTDDFHDFPKGEKYDFIVSELAHGEVNAVKKCIRESGCDKVIFYHMSSEPKIVKKLGVNRIASI